MKIRNGFVSNSSSSSFIVGFVKEELPISKEELQKMLFGDKRAVGYYDNADTTDVIAGIVWNDFVGQNEPLNDKQLAEMFNSGYGVSGAPRYDDYQDKDGNVDWDLYNDESSKFATEYAKKFRKDHPDKVFYKFHYSDDSEQGIVMEHGGIFDELFNVKISHH